MLRLRGLRHLLYESVGHTAQNGDRPRRRVFDCESRADSSVVYASVACMHCSDAPCVAVCPTGCLYKDEETGLTLYDTEKCVGCRSCARACPYGAPGFDKNGKMYKCDGRIDRQRAGLEPACVRACPVGALTLRGGASAPAGPYRDK